VEPEIGLSNSDSDKFDGTRDVNKPKFQRKEKGFKPGEDVYAALGRTNTGRLLSVFFIHTKDQRAIIVSARDMSQKERKKYVR